MKALLVKLLLYTGPIFIGYNCNSENKNKVDNAFIGKYMSSKEYSELTIFQNKVSESIFPFDSLNKHYALSHIIQNRDSSHLLIFYQYYGYGYYDSIMIIDTLQLGKIKNDQFIGLGNCRINKKVDKSIIGLIKGRFDNFETIGIEDTFNNNVLKAWNVDIIKGEINLIKSDNVDYYSEP